MQAITTTADTAIVAVFHQSIRTDLGHLDFDLPDVAKVEISRADVELWRSHAKLLQRLSAYSIQLHDYRCEFMRVNTEGMWDDEPDDTIEPYQPDDFRQDAATLFITTDGVQWRGYQKHTNGIQWITDRLAFDLIDARLAEAATAAGQPCMPLLCGLWNTLADVPVSTDEGDGQRLEAPFAHFDAGTDLATIWRWFEAQHPAFIVGEAGNRIGDDHPFWLAAN